MMEANGHILRIATREWVDQVFSLAIYYTNIRRKWQSGQTILFVHKTKMGDAFVGYGEVGNICVSDELSEDEKHVCEKWGWKRAIEFKYVIRFDKPLPIKETFLKDLKIRGRALHGFLLQKEQLASILSKGEQMQAIKS